MQKGCVQVTGKNEVCHMGTKHKEGTSQWKIQARDRCAIVRLILKGGLHSAAP